jgi:hypothetical protein
MFIFINLHYFLNDLIYTATCNSPPLPVNILYFLILKKSLPLRHVNYNYSK